MVQGTRLLLGAALALGLGPAMACKAETLGVDVPRGGPEAINQEDLSRDMWRLTEKSLTRRIQGTTPQKQAVDRVAQRYQEMHLLPAFGDGDRLLVQTGGQIVCQQKDGRSGKAIVVAGVDTGLGAAAATGMAVTISLAKTLDVPAPPRHTVVFCAWAEPGGRDAYLAQPAFPLDDTVAFFELLALSGDTLSEETIEASGPTGAVTITRLHTEAADWHGSEADGMERIDFRVLEKRVAAIYERIVAVP